MPYINLQNKQHFQQLLSNYKLVIVKVYAEWCKPCEGLSPLYKQLSDKLRGNDICFCEENIEQKINEVSAIPTTFYFLNGKRYTFTAGPDINKIYETIIDICNKNGIVYSLQQRDNTQSSSTQQQPKQYNPPPQPQQPIFQNNYNSKNFSSDKGGNYSTLGSMKSLQDQYGMGGGNTNDNIMYNNDPNQERTYIPQGSSIKNLRNIRNISS